MCDLPKSDFEIRLHGIKCPKNYAMIKLQLEDMSAGQVLLIEIDDGIPARNVHKSLLIEDVEILTREKISSHVRMLVRKN